MRQRNKPGSRPINLYRNLTLLIVFSLFAVFTLVYITVVSIGHIDSSSWLGKVQDFILSLYPSIFIIPFAFLFGFLIFRPVQESEREAIEERLLEKMKETLVPTLQSAVVNAHQISDSIQHMGIVEVNTKLDYAILKNRIAHSKERVWLSDNWLFPHINDFEEAFHQTTLNMASLRILLIDPESLAAKLRSIDLYNDEDHMKNMTKRATTTLQTFYRRFHMENLEVKYHSTLPSLQIFLCDNQATAGFYFHGTDSQYSTQVEVIIKNEKDEYTDFGRQLSLNLRLCGKLLQLFSSSLLSGNILSW
jgi:hypothetical protein